MKTREFELRSKSLSTKNLTLDERLAEAAKGEPVFLKVGRQVRFVVMTADEDDQEAHALRSNPEFMAYLDAQVAKACKEPRTSFEDDCAELGIALPARQAKGRTRSAS